MYATIDESGRIQALIEKEEYAPERAIEVDLPDGFDVEHAYEYVLKDGEFVHSPAELPTDVQIEDLKALLAETDYVPTKMFEAQVSGEELPKEDQERYAEVLKQRKAWRARISELENKVK